MGRVKPGVTPQQVEANLGGVFQQAARDGMNSFLSALPASERDTTENRDRTGIPQLRVTSGAHGIYDNSASEVRSIAILSAVVALILLIVCANVANLLLARATTRRHEISVRLSLGGTRWRLMRQLLTESLLLSLFGGGLGIIVAYWGKELLPGGAATAPVDWRVLTFAWALSVVTGLVFGIAPAVRATGDTASAALKEGGRTIVGSRALLGKSLVVVQVAVSLVVLVGAGLFLRTVDNLRRVDVGFDPQHLVLFRVNPQLNRYDSTRSAALYEQIRQRLQSVPGVRAVTLSNPPLLSGSVSGTTFIVQGRPYQPGPHNDIHRVRIAPNFFEAMGIPLVAGRAFSDRDNTTAAPKVAIINEAAARNFFPGEDPLGRRFGGNPETSSQIEVVGIVRNVKYNDLRADAPPTMYVPYGQGNMGPMAFEVRTAIDPAGTIPAIREAVRQADPNVPLMAVSTQIDQIERRFAQERIFARAYLLFGALALLVAAIGLFGLMSYSVTRRTNEIGIRMALGAERAAVTRMIVGESLVMVAFGLAIGLGSALAAGRLVATLLFGLAPYDPATIALVMAVMVGTSWIACYLPARRAARIDPMLALRYE